MEKLLNDPRTSPFTHEGAKGFKAVMDASQLPVHDVFRHLGKGGKAGPPQKTDKEKSEERIEKLEASEQKQ